MRAAAAGRRWFVPAVIQTSALDCGPASLQALLVGHGVDVRYGRLREECQIAIDGTSIDVIEDLLVRFGLDAAQYIVPVDHLLMAEADMLPCLVVTRQPTGLMHFVVIWRTHGPVVQVMDPGHGRVWQSRGRALQEAYVHRFAVTAAIARQWLDAPAFASPLRRRLVDVGATAAAAERMIADAQVGAGWLPLAALDAATRLVARLAAAGTVRRGPIAESYVQQLVVGASGSVERALALIPGRYWSALPLADGDVELRGAVILHVAGRTGRTAAEEGVAGEFTGPASAGEERPLRAIAAAALAESSSALLVLPLALLLAGAGVGIEVLLFQGLLRAEQPTMEMLALVGSFLLVSFALNLTISGVVQHLGRWLDVHLRVRLLRKLPRLGNYYFNTRLTSDLAYRAHELRALRGLPQLAGDVLRVASELVLTMAGILVLLPGAAVPAVLVMLVILGLPFALLLVQREQELRISTQLGTLSRFYLDALRGLTPIQAHCGEDPVRGEHEALLASWAAATRAYYRVHLVGLGVMTLAATAFAVWAIAGYLAQDDRSYVLLVVYWALKLPVLAQDLANTARRGPGAYNRLLRLFEVLGASEEEAEEVQEASAGRGAGPGVHIEMEGVAVVAGGHAILRDVALAVRSGEHVAIVGPSGSGKTSLVGLLLGWHRAAAGSVVVDGQPLHVGALQRLRRATAWVDPAVALWNRTLADNLTYGTAGVSEAALRAAVADADLGEVVARLPDGPASALGEGGGLVSGGEGQRVRLARALARPDVRLAILDEPFRGLDGELRRDLLAVARARWRAATLLYVSHDIDTALTFDRVLVIEGGAIVEDGEPAALLLRPGSRLAALADAQRAVERELWGSPVWRRWRMEQGELR
jgi:ABC-type bacteriocin/lantibiotic exporter with double-glycine peptidase domain